MLGKLKKTTLLTLLTSFFLLQSELPYVTWQEVQARIVEIQKEHQICIHKKELSELDIYHRILRFKNYMVPDSVHVQTDSLSLVFIYFFMIYLAGTVRINQHFSSRDVNV